MLLQVFSTLFEVLCPADHCRLTFLRSRELGKTTPGIELSVGRSPDVYGRAYRQDRGHLPLQSLVKLRDLRVPAGHEDVLRRPWRCQRM